jgi:hypothetical protein
MIGSLVDRLRGVLARDVDPESPDDRGLRERSGGDDPADVRDAQSAEPPPVAPPTSSHVPDAALGFDPWGVRTSSSWDIFR